MKNIFLLGDSISIQYAPHLISMMAGTANFMRKTGDEEALRNLDVPTGANGGDSRMVLAYLRVRCASGEFKPDFVLLNCGLHDIKDNGDGKPNQVDIKDYRANLTSIAALFKTTGTPWAWIRTTPLSETVHNAKASKFKRYEKDLAAYNKAADDIMNKERLPLIDLHGFTKSLGGDEIYCDHVHFTEEVRRLQGAYLAGWITREVDYG